MHHVAGWSSPVARQAHNLKVTGSNPVPATNGIAKAPDPTVRGFCAFGYKRCRQTPASVSVEIGYDECRGAGMRLPRPRMGPRLRVVTMRRPRSAFTGVILVVIALFGIIAVSGWHSAIVHDDDAIHASSVKHDHAPSDQGDPDAPIHILAHAMGQWVSITGPLALPIATAMVDRNWSPLAQAFRNGVDPAALLRPPRN